MKKVIQILNFYTAQFRYGGADRFDITVHTKNAFAPTWDMVRGIKNGTMTVAEYTRAYKDLLVKSLQNRGAEWEELLARDTVTLVCFCPANGFCHRYILARVLETLGATYKGER